MNTYRIVIFASLVLLAGCALDPTTAPDQFEQPATPSGTTWHGVYTETLTSAGGTIGDSDAWLVVAVNALGAPTELTMDVCPSSETAVYLGPASETFAVASTLSITKPPSYDAQDTYHVFRFNETTEEWEDQGGVDHGPYVSLAITECRDFELLLIAN